MLVCIGMYLYIFYQQILESYMLTVVDFNWYVEKLLTLKEINIYYYKMLLTIYVQHYYYFYHFITMKEQF